MLALGVLWLLRNPDHLALSATATGARRWPPIWPSGTASTAVSARPWPSRRCCGVSRTCARQHPAGGTMANMSLTSVDQDGAIMGKTAGRLLLEWIEGR